MTRQLLLGIDVGTQGARVALLDPGGAVYASHRASYDTITPRPGWAEQDPKSWWSITAEGIRRVIEAASARPGEILGVGVDAQMHAAIPLGKGGKLLSRSVQLWCDKRASGLVEAFAARHEASEAARLAGSPPVPAWWGFKLAWLKEFTPELYERTWQFVTGEGYINYRLTGELAVDWSEASGSFLLDTASLQWSPVLAGALGIDLQKLPPVLPSYQVMGHVHRAAALETGLPEGTPVVAGAGDLLSMLVASGLAEKGRGLDVSGTASNLIFLLDEPVLEPPMMNLHHASLGWCPFGVTDSGGGSLTWFKEQFCGSEVDYDLLNTRAAETEPGAEGLLFLPYLMGERVLGTPHARGVFFGLTPRSSTGAMARAILEGVTFELRRTLEIVENAGNPVSEIYTCGGGARSRLWSQIKADIYQKPVVTLAAEEGGVLGSAILAGVGVGLFPDVASAARQCVRIREVFQPDPARFERYDFLFGLFKDLHDRLQAPFNRLAELPDL